MDFENEAAETASTGKLKIENFVMSKSWYSLSDRIVDF